MKKKRPPPSPPKFSFGDEATRAFAFLVTEFGFDGPKCTNYGKEYNVEYLRDPYRITVVAEPGLVPLVEVEYPAEETGERPVPYLSSDGMNRAKRIHAVRREAMKGIRSDDDLPAWLDALAAELMAAEAKLLAGRA